MELDFDYKEGCYLFNGTSFPELVIHKTIYKIVTVTFQRFNSYEPFGFRVFDLTNKLDVEILNEKYKKTVAEQDPTEDYNVKLGTIVEYDYLKLIYLGITDKKILSFVLQRPILFDYIKARDKYLVADTLGKMSGLQTEFNSTWEQYFRIPLESKEKIEWDIISLPIALKSNVNENLLKDEFGNKFTDAITVYDFLSVIDTNTFNKIPSQEIKDEISKLIKKTLEIAQENDVIGKENPNRKPKLPKDEVTKIQEPKIKFFIEFTYTKGGERFDDVEEIEAVTQEEALDFGKKYFYDKHEGESDIDLLFMSFVDKPISKETNRVAPKYDAEKEGGVKTAEQIFQEGVDAKKNKNKKTQEELSKEIDEATPEDLLSLLNEL